VAASSLETRRRAVADALRAVAVEPVPASTVGARVDELTRQVADVLRRIRALEDAAGAEGVGDGVVTPPVPPLSMPGRGMSQAASRALFGD
jgi:hypothetical protein